MAYEITLRILVAEDEPSILDLYKIVLELNGHEVVPSRDGEECIKTYRECAEALPGSRKGIDGLPFDIVLLDYRMPKKDGLQVATEILSLCPRQRIVMVSAYASEIVDGLTKALKNSIRILQKPIEIENLTQILETERVKTYSDSNTSSASRSGLWVNDSVKEEMK